ncbi:transmembrane protein, putative (macronuclear) [Tetrahymena thermophila SB210]|uniref:Transmembrane protein, putative n=1 Tax=Tetrahymena thermophila (strain SB210) TaxID=312017 RepID=Q24GR4_TETTS|nr:transmembrane protein, putative [Tetrahymena thermophila SB210]EAS06943.1 transmembrane protein, putative [Tetrahymena thermophila SB210]|eukprot:XP_001027185.1 transmembrane protein, putative [Tetrahymena thermophila SB210]
MSSQQEINQRHQQQQGQNSSSQQQEGGNNQNNGASAATAATLSQTFKRQITFGKSELKHALKKIQEQKLQEGIKNHVYIEPKWNNSFTLEPVDLQLLIFLSVFIYILVVYLTEWLDHPIKKICAALILVMIYVSDCSQNGVSRYLDNIMTYEEFAQYIEQYKKVKAHIKYKVVAFHKETQRVRNSNGNMENVTKKIETYKQEFDFPIHQITDATDDTSQLFSKSKCFRVFCFANYSYGNEQSEEFFTTFKKFVETKASKADKEYEILEIFECEQQIEAPLKQNILVLAKNGKKDAMFNKFVYFVYSIVGLNLLFRILLNRRVPCFEYCLHKKIFVDPNKKLSDYIDITTNNLVQQNS